jgi:hypothetical protein
MLDSYTNDEHDSTKKKKKKKKSGVLAQLMHIYAGVT